MTPTVHQRALAWLWHWRTGGYDLPVLRQLYDAGVRVLAVQLQDDGPIPKARVLEWKALGFVVVGVVRPSHEPVGGDCWTAQQVVDYASSEKSRLGLNGLRFNFEDEVKRADLETNGGWSEKFASSYRLRWPRAASTLDTYFGAAAGGMNLGAYTTRGFRMGVQTYWGSEGLYDDPTPKIVAWCAGAQPPIPKAIVKPVFRVSPNNSGALPDPEQCVDGAAAAGTIGCGFYYVDGAPLAWLLDFIRAAIAARVAF